MGLFDRSRAFHQLCATDQIRCPSREILLGWSDRLAFCRTWNRATKQMPPLACIEIIQRKPHDKASPIAIAQKASSPRFETERALSSPA
jgi:hypothetical protein